MINLLWNWFSTSISVCDAGCSIEMLLTLFPKVKKREKPKKKKKGDLLANVSDCFWKDWTFSSQGMWWNSLLQQSLTASSEGNYFCGFHVFWRLTSFWVNFSRSVTSLGKLQWLYQLLRAVKTLSQLNFISQSTPLFHLLVFSPVLKRTKVVSPVLVSTTWGNIFSCCFIFWFFF